MSSVKKAQKIANQLDEELGFSLTSYQRNDLDFLRNKLEEFLDLEVETEELSDPEELASDDGLDLDEHDMEEDCQ
jgi:hypothetical protein